MTRVLLLGYDRGPVDLFERALPSSIAVEKNPDGEARQHKDLRHR